MTNLSRRSLLSVLLAGPLTGMVSAADDLATLYIPDEVDKAVDRAIESLLRYQKDDGSIADRSKPTAMTALAIAIC